MNEQITVNFEKVKQFLTSHQLDGVVLASRANFSWFTAGKLNYVNAASEQGVAALLITTDDCLCVTNTIEAPRIKQEELAESGIALHHAKWYDGKETKQLWQKLIGNKRIAADINVTSLDIEPMPDDFIELRFELSETAITQYRNLGR